MSKSIERRMVLRDQVTPTMNKINRNTLTYKKSVQNLKREGNKTFWNLRRSMVGVALAGVAMIKSLGRIRDLEEAYIQQSQAVAKLESVFRATGRATEEEVVALQKYASELQNIGVIGDEVTISSMQQLATYNVTAETIETLSAGMLDLVAQSKGLNATQGDAVNVANMVGKAMQGQVGALSRVGISFTDAQASVLKYGNESEKAAVMAQVLEQNVGGVNAALAATDEGQIKQVTNAIGDMQETLGGVVVTVKGAFARAFNENLSAIESKVNFVADSLNKWVDDGGVDRFIETLSITKQTLQDLTPVFKVATGAIIAYKVSAVYAAIAQQGLNAAMMANPIGFVIGGLAALVVGIVTVRKNKELLRVTVAKVWNSIAEKTENGVNGVISGFNSFLSAGEYLKSSFIYIMSTMWNQVISIGERRARDLVKPVNAVLRALNRDEINVDFGGAKIDTVAPTYSKTNYIKDIEIRRMSEEALSDIETAKIDKEKKDLENNTKALLELADAIDENTSATSKNTSALKKSSKDLTGEEIADKLLPRLERVVYG